MGMVPQKIDAIVNSIINELISCMRNIHALDWWRDDGAGKLPKWWMERFQEELIKLVKSGIEPDELYPPDRPVHIWWASSRMSRDRVPRVTEEAIRSFVENALSVDPYGSPRIIILDLFTQDKSLQSIRDVVQIASRQWNISLRFNGDRHVMRYNLTSIVKFERSKMVYSNYSKQEIDWYVREVKRVVNYFLNKLGRSNLEELLIKSLEFLKMLSGLLREAMARWLREHPEDHDALSWMCRNLAHYDEWDWYTIGVSEISRPLQSVYDALTSKYGRQAVDSLLIRLQIPYRLVVDDTPIAVLERDSWDIQLEPSSLRPHWMRAAILWVRNQVVPEIYRGLLRLGLRL